MIEFMQTLGRGIIQGFNRYIENDLQDQIPLFIFAGVVLFISLLMKIYRKIKTK